MFVSLEMLFILEVGGTIKVHENLEKHFIDIPHAEGFIKASLCRRGP